MIEALDTRYGRMFVPSTDSGQYWWLKTTGASPEDELIEMVCALLDERPPGIAVDCGANFGCWALPLARHADLVYAFEPQLPVFRLLERTLAANADLAVLPFNFALGAEPGSVMFPQLDLDRDTNFGGIAVGVAHPEQASAPMRRVPVATLDNMIPPDRGHVSFIKADVEGSELALLQGAVRTIERCKPVLIVEADHPMTDTQALGAFIESLGYNVEIARDNNFIGMPV